MADKSSSNWIGEALNIGGQAVSGYGQYEAGKETAAAQSAEGRLKQIEYNRLADEALQNASTAMQQSAVQQALLRRQGRETAENALSAYAGSGVVAGQGSAAYVPSWIMGRAEEDVYEARREGEAQQQNLTKQAQAYTEAGNQAAKAGATAAKGTSKGNTIGTITSVLGTAASIANAFF
ncbi:hypothetical protein BEE12_16080 [Pantoea agglomerans]|uniref:hypothetical protein n=1 Tax=Enterobacter agglomerans TaxID=549 RepID=UPI00083CEBC6|nr:hypothetical protein [Pantoea agglomerans]AOE41235.1 hypothetical protein BEE12_16080 [Pantoea agglomerans]